MPPSRDTAHRAARTAPRPDRRRAILLGALIAACATEGCTPRDDPIEALGPEVGRLIVTARERQDEQGDTPGSSAHGSRLIVSESAWEQWLEALPRRIRTEIEEAVVVPDPTAEVLVVHGAFRCAEAWSVHSPAAGSVQVLVDDREAISCVWSPFTVMVWRVPLDEAGAGAPEEIELLDPVLAPPARAGGAMSTGRAATLAT